MNPYLFVVLFGIFIISIDTSVQEDTGICSEPFLEDGEFDCDE